MPEMEVDTLSISYLNALEYCPRRFYYECALSEFLDLARGYSTASLNVS